MDFLRTSLEQQPLLAFFLTIGIGYLAGEINVKGLSLGVGAVLFVALAVGWFAPKSAVSPMLGTFGLALFLYSIGIQYGKQFFSGLTSPRGVKANVLALVGVLACGAVSLAFLKLSGLTSGHALGLFAGAGTSTPTLQAAVASLKNDDAAVGYSVAYPIGTAGPILALVLAFRLLKVRIAPPAMSGLQLLEIAVQRAEHFGRRLGELLTALPPDVRIVAIRRDQRNQAATPDTVLGEGDVLLAVAPTRELLEQVRKGFGDAAPGSVLGDRRDLDYLRVFASKAAVAGRTLGDLALPGGKTSTVIQVRRGDAELLPTRDLVLEFGDRVGLLAPREEFAALRAYFGDSIKGTAEFSYVSIGLGMALGFVLSAIPVPLPGIGRITLGLAGVLLAALVLGRFRRTGGLTWALPASATLVLRNLGLTVFLAQVGMASGPAFAATVAQTGPLMLGLAALALAALVLPILLIGLFALKMPFDEVAGIVAGACGNPAILAYANKLTPTEQPDLGYAMIYPGMTIVKILFVSIVPAFL